MALPANFTGLRRLAPRGTAERQLVMTGLVVLTAVLVPVVHGDDADTDALTNAVSCAILAL